MQSLKRAPDFKFQRLVTADEVGPFEISNGTNLGSYKTAVFQIVPIDTDSLAGNPEGREGLTLGTSDPEIEVLSWSPTLGRFISHNPESVLAGRGAGIPYEFTVEADGQILYVAITGGIVPGEGVAIFASGFEAIESSC